MKIKMVADSVIGERYFIKGRVYDVTDKESSTLGKACIIWGSKQQKEYQDKMARPLNTKGFFGE